MCVCVCVCFCAFAREISAPERNPLPERMYAFEITSGTRVYSSMTRAPVPPPPPPAAPRKRNRLQMLPEHWL